MAGNSDIIKAILQRMGMLKRAEKPGLLGYDKGITGGTNPNPNSPYTVPNSSEALRRDFPLQGTPKGNVEPLMRTPANDYASGGAINAALRLARQTGGPVPGIPDAPPLGTPDMLHHVSPFGHAIHTYAADLFNNYLAGNPGGGGGGSPLDVAAIVAASPVGPGLPGSGGTGGTGGNGGGGTGGTGGNGGSTSGNGDGGHARGGAIDAALRMARQAGGRASPDLTTENLVNDLPAAARRARFAEIFGRPPEEVSPLGDTARFLKEEALPTAVGSALPMIPKKVTAPAIAGLAGLLLNSDRGEAAGNKPSTVPTSETLPKVPGSSIEGMLPSSVANDPTVKLLMQQIKEQRAIADSPVRPEMSKVTREGAIQQSAALQQKLNERIAELTKASQPWKQAHPEWASAWPAVQVGAPMIAGLAAKNVADLATRAWNRPWNKAVNAAEEALFPPNELSRPNVMRAEYETNKAKGYEKSRGAEPGQFWSGVREHAVPAIAGGAAGVEAAMFPYQFDARNAPEGSAEQKAGQAALDDPLGTAWKWGGLGALTGWAAPHIVPSIGPGRHPGSETRALQDYMAGLKTPSAGAAANSATSPARGLASSEALPPLSPANSEASLPLMRQSLIEKISQAQKMLPPPEPVMPPNPPKQRVKSSDAPKTPREEAESYFKKPRKNKASSPGDQDYPFTIHDTFQRGGVVGQALRIAKQNGGATPQPEDYDRHYGVLGDENPILPHARAFGAGLVNPLRLPSYIANKAIGSPGTDLYHRRMGEIADESPIAEGMGTAVPLAAGGLGYAAARNAANGVSHMVPKGAFLHDMGLLTPPAAGVGGILGRLKEVLSPSKKLRPQAADAPRVGYADGGDIVQSGPKRYQAGGVVHAGPIQHAADGGRTDTVPLDVAPGSYVIPADIISGIGQGDTTAGYRALEGMFGPQGPKPAQGAGGPPVPILAAGGEFVISPDAVGKVGGGDLKRGHEALDLWVKMQRRKIIQELSKLPGPAKD